MKILLCEDDENLGMLLREYLQAKGYQAVLCQDGEVGYREFAKGKFDIAVLDVMMPKKDGFTLAQEIRQANTEIPIIFLTARALKDDILEGFKIGADDYITKPFHMDELMARVRIQLSSPEACQDQNQLTYGDLSLDTASLKLSCKNSGQTVELVRKEYLMLEYFLQNPQQVLSKEQIFERVWGLDSEVESNNLEVYVSFVRRKIKAIESKVVIKAVRGVGYRMEVQE